MRLVFAGTPQIALPSLDALAARHDIVAVVTQPDARGRRGRDLHPSPVKVAAQERDIPVFTPTSAADPDFVAQVRDLDADAAAVVAYGQILRPDLLAATRLGWVNLHFSLLPAWRGAAPVQRAIMAGDEVTGASAFVLDEGMDTGPVIGTVTERVRRDDTSGSLLERLATVAAPLLADAIDAWAAGEARPVAQPSDGVSYAAKLSRDDAYVRWERPAHVVDRQIRGCTPAPGAWTTAPGGDTLKLGVVTPRPDLPVTVPGQVMVHDGAVVVGTGGDPVQLSEVQPAGKARMAADAWWRGARFDEVAILGEA